MLSLTNGVISVKVDEDLGGEIRSIKMGKSEFLADFDWLTPVQNSKSTTYGSAILDWLSEYRGGWQVLFPNAGNENTVMGVPLPFHGEFGRTKTTVITKKKNELVIRKKNKTIKSFNGSKINIPTGPILVDANEMGELQDVKPGLIGSWPIVSDRKDGQIDLSVVPSQDAERLCYLHDRPEGWAAMEHGKKVIGISWDIEAFPHLWFWQEIGGKGFPWYGRAQITAIEPASTYPSFGLEAAIKSGQAFYLKPGEVRSAWTTFSVSALPVKDIMKIKSIDSKGNFQSK